MTAGQTSAATATAGFRVPWLAAGVGALVYFATGGDKVAACAAFVATILGGMLLALGLAAAIIALIGWANGRQNLTVRRNFK